MFQNFRKFIYDLGEEILSGPDKDGNTLPDVRAALVRSDHIIEETRATLSAAGHNYLGPLHLQVDRAIDTERMRHEKSLHDIAEALGLDTEITTAAPKYSVPKIIEAITLARTPLVQRMEAMERRLDQYDKEVGKVSDWDIPF